MFNKKKTFETSKPVMLDPIHLDNKTIIPISYIDITVLDIKYASIFGRVDTKGVVVIEDNDRTVLSIDEADEFEKMVNEMEELNDYVNSKLNQ